MAEMVLELPEAVDATSAVARFTPKYWEVNGDYLTAYSVITTGEDSARATFVVRRNTSLPGLYFWISQGNVRDHARQSYDTVYDWRGCTLQFRMISTGVRPIAGVLGAPGLTIVHTDNSQSIVDLSPYIIAGSGTDVTIRLIFSDTDPDRIKAGFPAADFDRSNIASMFFNVAIDEYQYGQCQLADGYTSGDPTIDVTTGNGLPFLVGDTLYIGAYNREITGVAAISGDDYRLTLASSIAETIPDENACYVIADPANYQAFASEITASIEFSDIVITGGSIPLRAKTGQPLSLGMAGDYSFDKLLTPERLVEGLTSQGYRFLSEYWSTTGFECLRWLTTNPIAGTYGYDQGGRWEIDYTKGFNDAFYAWIVDLLGRISFRLGMSQETLMHFTPEGWAQVDADGNFAPTGYGNAATPLTTPWTNFIDPANENAKAWLLKCAQDYADACAEVGVPCRLNMGEPNHSNGFANFGKYKTWPKPAMYGEATIDWYAARQGVNLSGAVYAVTGASLTISRSSGAFQNIVPGMWVRTAGFANDENNGWWRIASSTGTSITFADLARKNETATATLDRGPGWDTDLGPRTTTATFEVAASSDEITGPSFVWAYLEAGWEVQFTGFANEGNNGTWRVVSIGEFVAAFEPATLGQAMIDEAEGADVTIKATPERWINNDVEVGTSGTLSYETAYSMQALLAEFLSDIAAGYQNVDAAEWSVLALPDNFTGIGGLYDIVNRPAAGLGPSTWSMIVWEPYRDTQLADAVALRQGFGILRNELGWGDFSRVELFAGVVSLAFFPSETVPSYEDQWQTTTDFIVYALGLKAQRVTVWARPQTIGTLDDGSTGRASWSLLATEAYNLGRDNSEVWFARPNSAADAQGFFRDARTGLLAPARFKRRVGGRDYISSLAPRNGPKENPGP